MLTLPIHRLLSVSSRVLIAGAGGGFDLFSGLPLYFALKGQGKDVYLANLTFSNIPLNAGRRPVPELVEITADSQASSHYFPEKHLCKWFADRGESVSVWCIERFGPAAVTRAYRALWEELKPDTLILIDGGTDSLMRGDESGLGTPVEDISSIAAADTLGDLVERSVLVCLGFGVDAFHGVSHVDFLQATSELTRSGDFLGTFSLTLDMPEVKQFVEATRFVLEQTPSRPSIVCTSILSALEGHFGNHQTTSRTADSELFINPLMTLYWCYQLRAVAQRILYLDRVRNVEGFLQAKVEIEAFRDLLPTIKPYRAMPL